MSLSLNSDEIELSILEIFSFFSDIATDEARFSISFRFSTFFMLIFYPINYFFSLIGIKVDLFCGSSSTPLTQGVVILS